VWPKADLNITIYPRTHPVSHMPSPLPKGLQKVQNILFSRYFIFQQMGSCGHINIMRINGRCQESCWSQWFGATDTYLVKSQQKQGAEKERTLHLFVTCTRKITSRTPFFFFHYQHCRAKILYFPFHSMLLSIRNPKLKKKVATRK